MLAYTGEPRNSGINNWEVTKAHINGDRGVQKNFDRAELEMMGTQMEEMFEQLAKKQPRLKVPSQTDHAAPLG